YPRILSHYPLVQAAAGCPVGEWCRLHQVHGAGVVRVKRGAAVGRTTPGGALVSDAPARSIAVRVADCVPVLLATRDGRTVAAVHAGWRGTVAGVLPATLREMRAASPRDVVAAIGPCISFEAFEVGPEVLAEFTRVFDAKARIRR